jgi:hypothetical protein
MAQELNNETWLLRSSRLDQPSKVQKLLREGFEPFWGIPVKTNNPDKSVVKMYFRKPPVLMTVELAKETAPIQFDITPLEEFAKQLRSLLSGVLDTFADGFFGRLEKELNSNPAIVVPPREWEDIPEPEADELNESKKESLTNEDKEAREDNRAAPTGDDFRVVDDVPKVTTVDPTPQQQATIEALKQKGNTTMLPGVGEDGSVRLMVGSIEYKVGPSGNFTERETGAGTNSLAV